MPIDPETEVLMKIYSEELAYARHHSSMRSNVTGLICAIAGAVLAFAGEDGLTKTDVPLTMFIALLGLFGIPLTLKHFERGHVHRTRAKKIREAVDARWPAAEILKLREDAETDNKGDHPLLERMKFDSLWAILNCAVFALGIIATGMALGWMSF